VLVLIAVGYAAITWGVDSRELTPDDHQRLDSWVGRTHRS
jgi:hypothetical protein